MALVRNAHIPLELCVYGKLPLYEEYLRVRCFRGAAGSFREWIDQGFDQARRTTLDSALQASGVCRVLFFPEGLKEGIVGTIRGSTDRGRARVFPFTVFTTVPRKHLSPVTSESVRQVADTWQELTEWSDTMTALESLEDYRAILGRGELSPLDPKPRAAQRPDVDLLALSRALCEPEDTAAAFGALLWNIRCAYRAIASGRIPGHRLPALRLPLAPGFSTEDQVTAWLECLESSGFLVVRPSTPVTLAFPAADREGGALWVVRRPPRPIDFTMLVAAARGHLHPEPEGERPPVLGRTEFVRQVERRLFRPGSSLHALGRLSLETVD